MLCVCEFETHVCNAFQGIGAHTLTDIDFVSSPKRELFCSLVEKFMVVQVGSRRSQPLSMFVCQHAFNGVNRLFSIWKFHLYKEEQVAKGVVFPVSDIEVEVVQFNRVIGFELEMNGIGRFPPIRIDGLISLEFARGFTGYSAKCQRD